MYIEKELYLSLYLKYEQTQKQNDILSQQNMILANEVEKQKVANEELKKKMSDMQAKQEAHNTQLISQLHTDIKEYMKVNNDQQKQLVQVKFNELERSSIEKYQALESRYKDHMLQTYTQFKFCHKLMKYYRQDVQVFDKSVKPTYQDLKRWIKDLINTKIEYKDTNQPLLAYSEAKIMDDINQPFSDLSNTQPQQYQEEIIPKPSSIKQLLPAQKPLSTQQLPPHTNTSQHGAKPKKDKEQRNVGGGSKMHIPPMNNPVNPLVPPKGPKN